MPSGLVGYLAIVVATAATLAVTWRRYRGPGGELLRAHAHLQAFFVVSIAIFYDVPRFSSWLRGAPPSATVAEWRYQAALVLLCVVYLIEWLVLTNTRTLPARVFAPSMVLTFGSLATVPLAGLGIINVAWTVILAAAQSGLTMATSLFSGLAAGIPLVAVGDPEVARRNLDLVRTEMNGLVKTTTTATLALGASVGVSMSILFREGEKAWRNPVLLALSFNLIFGFLVVCLGVVVWVLMPYLRLFERVRYFFGPIVLSSSESDANIRKRLAKGV